MILFVLKSCVEQADMINGLLPSKSYEPNDLLPNYSENKVFKTRNFSDGLRSGLYNAFKKEGCKPDLFKVIEDMVWKSQKHIFGPVVRIYINW